MNAAFLTAQDVGNDLINLVYSFLPIRIAETDGDPLGQLQWIPVRLTGTLQSILHLGQIGQHEDSAALLRVMTEHLIVFAWLLADPQPPSRINVWKNDDVRLINVSRDSLQRLGFAGEAPLTALTTSAKLVNAETAAQQCDEFWAQKLAPFLKPGTANSFSGLYAAVFRGASPYVHPSLRGGMGFFTTPKDGGGKIFYIDRSYADLPSTYTQAVTVHLLGTCLLVARFRHGDVAKVASFFPRLTGLKLSTS